MRQCASQGRVSSRRYVHEPVVLVAVQAFDLAHAEQPSVDWCGESLNARCGCCKMCARCCAVGVVFCAARYSLVPDFPLRVTVYGCSNSGSTQPRRDDGRT